MARLPILLEISEKGLYTSYTLIACIEDPPVIERILNHVARKDSPGLWAESRAPLVCVQRTGRPAERTGLLH